MSNNDYIIKAVKGEPGSLTSTAFNTGVIVERQRLIKLLTKYGVMRASMLGDDWLVIYTENGAMDITRDRLEGTDE
jgi:hypothetical protein